MTKEIIERLAKWREERGLTIEGQREGLAKNLKEEFEELKESHEKKDREAMIDAYCDMCVLLINSGFDIPTKGQKIFNPLGYKGASNIKELGEMVENKDYKGVINTIPLQVRYLGFSIEKCLLETIKEIESRTGSWCKESKKWIKDTSPEAQAKWYKADYSRCKPWER